MTYFLPYYRSITDDGGGACSPYLLYGDGETYMKISMFLKSWVRPLPVLPKGPQRPIHAKTMLAQRSMTC